MASNNYYAGYQYGQTSYSGYVNPGIPSGVYAGQTLAPSYPSTSKNVPLYDQSYAANQIQATYAYPSRNQATGYSNEAQYQTQAIPPTAYPFTQNTSGYTNTYNSVVTNYAASALYQQQNTIQPEADTSAIFSSSKTSNWDFKKSLRGKKPVNKTPQTVHYCEICKISCAGPQTYKEHLDGQRHKKKEAQMKNVNTAIIAAQNKRSHSNSITVLCELCDVVCTGNDAYTAHIRGSKHQKVLKLHTKMGKPIPPMPDPFNNYELTTNPIAGQSQSKIKVLGTPKINFVQGGRLHTTANSTFIETDTQMDDSQAKESTSNKDEVIDNNMANNQSTKQSSLNESFHSAEQNDKDSQPVGQDYIEQITSDDMKNIIFHCKLCDCRFSDPSAKEMHLKGRRHKLQYKKKVDPTLIVDYKPSSKNNRRKNSDKITDKRSHLRQTRIDLFWNDFYSPQTRFNYMSSPYPMPLNYTDCNPQVFRKVGVNLMESTHLTSNPMASIYKRGSVISWDDNHIMQKHNEIIPKEDELDEIHHVVQISERALKLVSDKLAEEDAQVYASMLLKKEIEESIAKTNPIDSQINKDETISTNESNKPLSETKEMDTVTNASTEPVVAPTSVNESLDKSDDIHAHRILKGLVRVGPLGKNLLLTDDKEVDLVVICSEKPTKFLLQRVVECLPKQLQSSSPTDQFEVTMKIEQAGLLISSLIEPKIIVNVSLTSPLVRETNLPEGAPAEMVKEPKQMLDKQKCLDALAALRHAKWFQARVANRHPGPIIIKIIRDLCRRLPTWSKLSLWSVELLCERIVDSAGEQLTPGEAFRHVLEAIASGLLLPGGSGLFDPCEKDPTDALSSLSRQEREDITSSAQHALRLIAFRQIHKILAVEPISNQRNKKRPMMNENEFEEQMQEELASAKKRKEEKNFAEDEAISANDGANNFIDNSIEQILFERINNDIN